MTVKELISKLNKVNPDARVFMGYDGNVVVTESGSVEEIKSKKQIGYSWFFYFACGR